MSRPGFGFWISLVTMLPPNECSLALDVDMWRRHRTQVRLNKIVCVTIELHFVWFKITLTGTPIEPQSALVLERAILLLPKCVPERESNQSASLPLSSLTRRASHHSE